MNYDLIGFDLDGTLTDSDKNISDNTRQMLFDLMEQGLKVVLVSGRPIEGVMPVARELRLDQYDGYIMGNNGGNVVRCNTGEMLYEYTLPEHVKKPIYDLAMEYPGMSLVTYGKGYIIAGRKSNKYVEYDAKGEKMPIRETEHFLEDTDFPLNKLVLAGEPEYVAEIMEKLEEPFGSILNIFTSEPFFGEIMPRGIDKGYSLQLLVEGLGIRPERVMTFGDSNNDVPMIRYAGMGVAMGNALPEVKAAADYITLTNDEEGVYHAIKKFI